MFLRSQLVAGILYALSVAGGALSAQQKPSCGDIVITAGKPAQLTALYTKASSCSSGAVLTVQWTGLVQLTAPIIVSKGSTLQIVGQGDEAEASGGSVSRLFVLDQGAALDLTNMRLTDGYHEPASTSTSAGFTSLFTSGSSTPTGGSISGGSETYMDTVTAFDPHASSSFSYSSLDNGGFGANEKGGGAIYAGFDSIVTLTDCVFEGNAASTGGALYAREGSAVSIYSTQFIDNSATAFGGAVQLIGSLVMEDSSFIGNSVAGGSGGAMGISPQSSAVIRNSNFTSNTATAGGGAIYASSFGTFINFDPVTIELKGKQPSKAIYLTMEGCRLTNNTAIDSQGGGIRVRNGAILNITDTIIEENNGREGGGLMLDTAVAFFQGSSFIGNVGNTGGGGAYVVTESGARFDSCLFHDNFSPGNGGGLYSADESSIVVSSSSFDSNSAGNSGGAMSVQYADITISKCNFNSNIASSSGSTAHLFFCSVIVFDNSTVVDSSLFSVAAMTLSQCDDVSLSALHMEFSRSPADEGQVARSTAISIANSVVDAYDMDFNGWEGETVVSNVEGILTLDKADFTSCKAPLLLSTSAGAISIVRNPLLDKDNYPAASDTVIIEGQTCADGPCGVKGAACTDGSNGDLFCSCYKSDIAGKVCTTDSDDLLAAADYTEADASGTGDAASSSVINLSVSGGGDPSADLVAYYPDDAATTYVITALWDDPQQALIWHANITIDGGDNDDGLTLSTIPSAGVLVGGSSASIVVTASVSSASAPAANMATPSTFVLTAAGSDGATVASLTEHVTMEMWLCEAGFYWDGSECQSCSLALLGEGINGVDCSQPGATLQTLTINKGYWRVDEEALNIRRCRVGKACAGGSTIDDNADNYCAAGYKGPYCAVCASGYGSTLGGQCHECSSSAKAGLFTLVAIFFVGFALVVFFTARYLLRPVVGEQGSKHSKKREAVKGSAGKGGEGGGKKGHTHEEKSMREYRKINRSVSRAQVLNVSGSFASSFKILLVATQIITQYCDVVGVEFVGAYAKMLDVLNVVNFDLSFLASATCVMQTNLYYSVIVLTLAPVIMVLLLATTYVIAERRSRRRHSRAAPSYPVTTSLSHSNTWLIGDSAANSKENSYDMGVFEQDQGQTGQSMVNMNGNNGGGGSDDGDDNDGGSSSNNVTGDGSGPGLKSGGPEVDVEKISDLLLAMGGGKAERSAPPPHGHTHTEHAITLASTAHNEEGEGSESDDGDMTGGVLATEEERTRQLTSSLVRRHGEHDDEQEASEARASQTSHHRACEVDDESRPDTGGGCINSSTVVTYPEIRTIIRKKHVTVLVAFLFIMYCTLSTAVFQVLSPCDKLDDGRSYLRADYSLECSGTQYHIMYAYAAVMVFVYPVGIPAIFTYILRRYRTRLLVSERSADGKDMRKNDPKIAHIYFLWTGYQPQAYYYELVEFARRLMLSSILVFVVPNSVGQEASACLFAFFFAMLFEALAPMADVYEKHLYRSSAVFIFLTVFLSLVAKVDVADETHYDQKVYEIALVAMNVLLIALFIVNWIFQALWIGKNVRRWATKNEDKFDAAFRTTSEKFSTIRQGNGGDAASADSADDDASNGATAGRGPSAGDDNNDEHKFEDHEGEGESGVRKAAVASADEDDDNNEREAAATMMPTAQRRFQQEEEIQVPWAHEHGLA